MNILYARTDVRMAGPAIVMLKTSVALLKRNHNVIVTSGGGSLHKYFGDNGIKSELIDELAINRRNISDFVRAIRKVREIIISNKIEVAHGHNFVSTLIMYIASLFCGRKLKFFTTIHGVGKERFFSLAPGRLVAVSQYVKDRLIFAGVKETKIEVIHNGFIDLNKMPTVDLLKDYSHVDGRRLEIISVAMMTRYKGHFRILDSFALCLESNPNIQLKLVGDGIIKDDLISYSKELGILDKVIFLGRRDDIPELLSKADIFIHVPDYETFGMVVLEAMSVGLPIIAANVGGVPELVSDTVTGFLVDNNIEQITRKLVELVNDSSLRLRMGTAGRKAVGDSFELTKTIDKYEKLYGVNVASGENSHA